MSEPTKIHPLVRSSARPGEWTYSHPLNPRSEMNGVSLSHHAGMRRIGVHVVRLKPGKESCVYHAHTSEEEFFYILSGKGITEIDGKEYEVGPGDFMGFPTPSVAHHLKNASDEDLVYLVGGERHPVEVADFPHLDKKVIRVAGEAHVVATGDLQPFWKKGS